MGNIYAMLFYLIYKVENRTFTLIVISVLPVWSDVSKLVISGDFNNMSLYLSQIPYKNLALFINATRNIQWKL